MVTRVATVAFEGMSVSVFPKMPTATYLYQPAETA